MIYQDQDEYDDDIIIMVEAWMVMVGPKVSNPHAGYNTVKVRYSELRGSIVIFTNIFSDVHYKY